MFEIFIVLMLLSLEGQSAIVKESGFGVWRQSEAATALLVSYNSGLAESKRSGRFALPPHQKDCSLLPRFVIVASKSPLILILDFGNKPEGFVANFGRQDQGR